MKLHELVKGADRAYCPTDDGLLLQYLDKDGKLLSHEEAAKVERPDTLALFIVREISDMLIGEDVNDHDRHQELVADAMDKASDELARVAASFRSQGSK